MKSVLTIKNWRTYQHYKNRNPPWIKLHFELLSSKDWVMLDDASRVLAVACMLLASRSDGEIDISPAGLEYIKRVAYLNSAPDFNPLVNCGFMTDASGLLADASTLQADACSESESESESEAENTLSPKPDKCERFSKEILRQVDVLDTLMRANNPAVKIPELGTKARSTWNSDMDKLNRIDGYNWQIIDQVTRWCQADDFWKSNILSPGKLRRQFGQLVLKAKAAPDAPRLDRALRESLDFELAEGGAAGAQEWILRQKKELQPLLLSALRITLERGAA